MIGIASPISIKSELPNGLILIKDLSDEWDRYHFQCKYLLSNLHGPLGKMSQMFIVGMLMLMLIRMIILPRRHEIHGYWLTMTLLT